MRHLLLPFRPAPLMLVGVFGVGYWIALQARLLGIPLAIIVTSWFFKYCFVLFDAAVAGEEPPVLSIEMVNPFNEQRPLMQLLLIIGLFALVVWLRSALGLSAAIAAAALSLAVLPAVVGLLGITGSAVQALSPHGLATLIRGLGWTYGWILIGTWLGVGVLRVIEQRAPAGVSLILDLFAFLMFFAALGGAMHEHRIALGFTTLTRAERESERREREHSTERDHMLGRAYSLFRLRKRAEGWREIEQWIDVHGGGDDAWKEWSALLSASARWDDPAVADRLADLSLAKLLAAGETGHALELAEQRLAQHPAFSPSPAELAVRLAELAGLAGKRSLQRSLARRDNGEKSS